MRLYVIAIKDRQVDAFSRPAFVRTSGEALRAFTTEVNSGESAAAKHPEDYALYHLGWFDDEAGTFIPPDEGRPLKLTEGSTVKE